MKLSKMNKTWIFDLDGTLVKHNAYLDGEDEFLPKSIEFLKNIPQEDVIIVATAREKKYEEQTKKIFEKNNIRIDYWLFGLPYGERIIFNDQKPKGLITAIAICPKRDEGLQNIFIEYDDNI